MPSVKTPKPQPISIRLPEPLRDWIYAQAAKAEITPSEYLRVLIVNDTKALR